MKKVVTFLLVLALGITTMFTALPQMTKGASAAGEVRGLWVAFCDFQSLGLANKSRSTYTRNVGKLLDKSVVFYMPTVTPMVAIAYVWKLMYNPQIGVFHSLLGIDGVLPSMRTFIPPKDWKSVVFASLIAGSRGVKFTATGSDDFSSTFK